MGCNTSAGVKCRAPDLQLSVALDVEHKSLLDDVLYVPAILPTSCKTSHKTPDQATRGS